MRPFTVASKIFNNVSEKKSLIGMLSEIYRTIIYTNDEFQYLNEICRIIVEIGGYQSAWIGFAENMSEESDRPVAQIGYPPEIVQKIISSETKNNNNGQSVSFKILENKLVIVNNILKNKKFSFLHSNARNRGFNSMISVPITIDKNIPAALHILSKEDDALKKNEVQVFKDLAENVSRAALKIRQTSLVRETTKQLEMLCAKFAGILKVAEDAIISVDNKQNIVLFNIFLPPRKSVMVLD
ncbi:MAG TPA: GAF domain-containing protein [Bacteroidetes bacterium]|nr:GAF domain-containing protein [Bacteroidota bacterium]